MNPFEDPKAASFCYLGDLRNLDHEEWAALTPFERLVLRGAMDAEAFAEKPNHVGAKLCNLGAAFVQEEIRNSPDPLRRALQVAFDFIDTVIVNTGVPAPQFHKGLIAAIGNSTNAIDEETMRQWAEEVVGYIKHHPETLERGSKFMDSDGNFFTRSAHEMREFLAMAKSELGED